MSKDLVNRIIDLREKRDWTQAELGRKIGLEKSAMNKIENGTRKVSTEELQKLAEIFNVELKSIEDIEYYARKLQSMGAKNVLISMAKDGSLLIDETGKKHRLGVCQGIVKNSVGAGDSMVAGFVAGCLLDMDYSQILKLATASGGATAFSHGLATKEKIDELIKQL